jgi:hypothetical protein
MTNPPEAETVKLSPFAPDPDMTQWELDVLRVLNGESVAGFVGGAAANVAASWLKARGYAEGHYYISKKGREYLAGLSALEPSR